MRADEGADGAADVRDRDPVRSQRQSRGQGNPEGLPEECPGKVLRRASNPPSHYIIHEVF